MTMLIIVGHVFLTSHTEYLNIAYITFGIFVTMLHVQYQLLQSNIKNLHRIVYNTVTDKVSDYLGDINQMA